PPGAGLSVLKCWRRAMTSLAASAQTELYSELAADTPEVLVDLAVLRANIERAARMAREASVSLRPHAKTHKLPQVAQMQLAAGAAGIQVAKLGEAEVMVSAGIDDVLIGYPVVGDRKLERLMALTERARISVSLDSIEAAAGIANAARATG